MSFANLLYEWYKKKPSDTFLLGDRNLNYEDATREISSIASNISPGEKIVHFEFNSIKSVLHYLAAFWAGAKIVSVDPLTSAEDLKFILEDSQPDKIFTDDETYSREKNILKDYKIWKDETKNEFIKPYDYMENEVGLIYYYAGIVGRTMQVMHSANRIELNSASLYSAINLHNISTILTIPLAHVLGNSVLGIVLEDGGSLYVMKKFDANQSIEIINKYAMNFIATVPMVYDALIKEKGSLDSLELCISTAAPLFPSTINGFKERFGKDIVQQYGFTEGLVITFQPKEFSKVISIGKPLPNAEIKVIKDDGKEAKIGEIGELWVKAPWLMLGYKDIEETAKVFNDGWLKTGDLVSYDDNGLLYFKGIKKRMLKYKGYPIFPRDLEEILKSNSNVIDAFVFGEDSGNLGSQPVAKVVVKDRKPNLEEELLNYVNSKVAFYKRLKKIYIVDKIE